MEGDLDDCEFWLPPQFLTDDDLLMEFKQQIGNEASKLSGFRFNNSGLTSPVESVLGSTETESDEDDYVTGLTRKMAHSTLDELSHRQEATKAWGLSGSPKSPLCGGFIGYSSGRCSPECAPPMASTHGLKLDERAWDLFCASAGEVSRLTVAKESAGYYPGRNGLVGPPRKRSLISAPLDNSGRNFWYSSNQHRLPDQQLQAIWFEELKRHHLMMQQRQANSVWSQGKGGNADLYQPNFNHQMALNRGRNDAGDHRLVGLSTSAWPTSQQPQPQQQQQPSLLPHQGSGMRAVFLGNPGTKRECAGTGVFLPRRIGSPTESRNNKPACSTVLLPDRVVQALNLRLEPMDSQPQAHLKHDPTFSPICDAALKCKKNFSRTQQRPSGVRKQPLLNHQDLRLPQEWTY